MNIEKTECDRLGYEYASVLEHITYLCHHAPFIKDYINEETMKKFDDLCEKLATGDCEIIEFKRKLSSYDFTDVLEEKDKQINQLQSNWNSLREINNEAREYLTSYEAISTIQGLDDIEKNKQLDEKTINEMTNRYLKVHDKLLSILDKMNELEGKDNNES